MLELTIRKHVNRSENYSIWYKVLVLKPSRQFTCTFQQKNHKVWQLLTIYFFYYLHRGITTLIFHLSTGIITFFCYPSRGTKTSFGFLSRGIRILLCSLSRGYESLTISKAQSWRVKPGCMYLVLRTALQTEVRTDRAFWISSSDSLLFTDTRILKQTTM